MSNNKKNKFLNNLSYAFIAQIISLLLSITMSLIVPKILGVEGFGYWQLFIFYSNYMGFFHFGLNDGVYLKYGGIEYKNLDKILIGSQFWFGALFQSIIAIGIGMIAITFVNEQQRVFILVMAAIYLLLYNLSLYLGFVFQASNETKTFSISVILDKVIYILSIILLIIFKIRKFEYFVILFLIAKLVAFIYCIVKGKEIVFTKLLPTKKIFNESINNIKIGINLTLSNIAGMIILGAGRFFVDKAWGIEAFGKFSFSISLTSFFLMFISQISMVLFPVLRQTNREGLKKYYNYISNILGILLPGILVLYIPMKSILGLWLPQYKESLTYLSLLLPLCIFDGKMQLLCNTYFKVYRKEKIMLRINIITMIISIILSLIGAYILHNIYFIVVSMVIAVGFRSIIAEIYLANMMSEQIISSILIELILVIVFMISSWYLNSISAFVAFLFVYIIILIIERRKIINVYSSIVKLALN